MKQEMENNEQTVEKKKDLISTHKKKIILFIVLAVLVSYIVYTLYLLIKQPTDTFTVEEGNLYLEETDIGYIIRDEQVVKGENYKNEMEQIIAEGEKAGKDEAIFRYYSNNEENLKQKIDELDIKIQEAMSALQVLGYNKKEIEKAFVKISDKNEMTTEELIKKGLVLLSNN